MCGVAGYVCNKKHAARAFAVFTRLMEESQVRGKHAAGVSWAKAGQLETWKQPVPAKQLVQTAEWEVLRQTPPTAILGHTRYSTSGNWHDNDNNQPLASAQLALVHNGLVSMAERGRVERQYGVKLKTANDSEVLLRRVEKAQGDVVKALEAVYRVEAPIFALGLLDAGGGLRVVRDHLRPLWLVSVEALGLTGFASTRDIVDRAAKGLGLRYKVWAAEPYVVYGLSTKGVAALQRLPRAVPSEPRWKRPAVQHPMMAAAPTPLKLEYDKGRQFDHRLNLRKSFKQYCVAAVSTWEVDPNYPLLNYIFRRFELSKSQEYWVAFLYATFYHPGSVFYVLQEFPEFEKVDLERLKKWHAANWRSLQYNVDRKYEKGHFVEMFESYLTTVGSQTSNSQEEYFAPMLRGTPVENFHNVTAALRKLLRFGRYSVYIYTECLARCMGMPIKADTVFLKESDSPRAGLCKVLGKDAWTKGSLAKEQWLFLEAEATKLMREIQKEYPKLGMDHWLMESCLCAHKGYMRPRRGRYLGYYFDRMFHEINQMAELTTTSGIDWNVLLQFRKECIIPEYLGEFATPPRFKVEKTFEHVLRDTGRMLGLAPIKNRGVL